MFALLKDEQTGEVEVDSLVTNLTGSVYETVDFRKKVFRSIFKELRDANKLDKLKEAFESVDRDHCGFIDSHDLKACLQRFIRMTPEKEIEMIIRFLEKDLRGRVDFMNFIERMTTIGDKNFNPFRNVVVRLKEFMEKNGLSYTSFMDKLLKSGEKQSGRTHGHRKVTCDYFADFLLQKVEKR